MKVYLIILLASALAISLPFSGNSLLFAQQEEIMEEEIREEAPQKEKSPEEKKEKQKQTEAEELEVFEKKKQEEETIIDAPPSQAERMKYFREKYEDSYEKNFEEVWAAVLKSLEEKNCMMMKKNFSQNDQGFYKGTIVSDYCVFATGSDTTVDNLKLYSIKIPVIRGGVWVTGRFQYRFSITEKEDGTVYLVVKGEVSGFEEYVTTQFHFWDSNGYLETMMLKKIREVLALPAKQY